MSTPELSLLDFTSKLHSHHELIDPDRGIWAAVMGNNLVKYTSAYPWSTNPVVVSDMQSFSYPETRLVCERGKSKNAYSIDSPVHPIFINRKAKRPPLLFTSTHVELAYRLWQTGMRDLLVCNLDCREHNDFQMTWSEYIHDGNWGNFLVEQSICRRYIHVYPGQVFGSYKVYPSDIYPDLYSVRGSQVPHDAGLDNFIAMFPESFIVYTICADFAMTATRYTLMNYLLQKIVTTGKCALIHFNPSPGYMPIELAKMVWEEFKKYLIELELQ